MSGLGIIPSNFSIEYKSVVNWTSVKSGIYNYVPSLPNIEQLSQRNGVEHEVPKAEPLLLYIELHITI
jgi:hypothetical protein